MIALALALFTGGCEIFTPQEQPPNVLLVYIEDSSPQEWAAVPTPHMDRFTDNSFTFTEAYAPVPLCNPSRVAVFFGLRAATTNTWLNQDLRQGSHLEGVRRLPGLFRDHGWNTAGVGKISHQGISGAWFDPTSWMKNEDPRADAGPDRPQRPPDSAEVWGGPYMNGPNGELGRFRDTKITDQAMEWVLGEDEPWLIAAGYRAPHLPFIYPERFHELFAPEDVPSLPAGEETEWKDSFEPASYWNYWHPPLNLEPDEGRRLLTVWHWRTIAYIDEQLGRLWQALQISGKADRTIVVLLSDHGLNLGYHDRYMKLQPWERESRILFSIFAPGLAEIGSTDAPVESTALYATLCELAGLEVPPEVEVPSLVPHMRQAQNQAFAISMVQTHPGGAPGPRCYSIRQGSLKLGWWETGVHQLIDLTQDPGEYVNLWDDAAYQGQKNQLLQLLNQEVELP